MRKVFSSARIENAEAVAGMLRDEGIEVRLENGRSFRRGIRGNFSYRHPGNSADNPSVWVVRSDDQPRARQMLREAGLLDEGGAASRSYLPHATLASRAQDAELSRRRGRRLRLMLLAGAAIVVAAVVFKPTPDEPWQPTPRRAAPAPVPMDPALGAIDTVAETIHLIPTPPALAAEIARRELAQGGGAALCLAIEGRDPPEATLAGLRAEGLDVAAASACPAPDALRVDVYAWRTDGSGSGEVTWAAGRASAPGRTRTATAGRDGDYWHVDAPR